ncbi:MAG: hypothetical protein II306_09990 [Clostridia bacterium]|nr:hypothetical protein [Clostridia bacterium]
MLDGYERLYQEYKDSPYRREREYASYLDRYLHDKNAKVDGKTYEERQSKKPMSYNVYFS